MKEDETFEINDDLDEDFDDKDTDKDKGKDKEKDTDKDDDDFDSVLLGDEDEDELEEKKTDKDKKKESDKEKDKEPTEHEKQIEKQEKQIKNLNIALHAERQAKKQVKKDAEGEPALTETQLAELFKEHQDDPNTLYSLVSYMVKQGSQKAQDSAVDVTEISQRKKELDSGIVEAFPDLAKDDSELRINTNDTIKSMRLQDHPYKDFLAISAMIHKDLPEIRKSEYEKGKKEALESIADGNRKKKAKEANLSPSGDGGLKNKGNKLNANMEDVANRIGLSKRGRSVYQQLVKKQSAMEV